MTCFVYILMLHVVTSNYTLEITQNSIPKSSKQLYTMHSPTVIPFFSWWAIHTHTHTHTHTHEVFTISCALCNYLVTKMPQVPHHSVLAQGEKLVYCSVNHRHHKTYQVSLSPAQQLDTISSKTLNK